MKAKTNTYAAGEGTRETASRAGAKDYSYASGDFKYMDSYVGELDFAGQEIVWEHDRPIWAMNYYGTALDPVEGFPEFLFEALRLVPEEAPYRGPRQHNSDKFKYVCSWHGDIHRFHGEEQIVHKGKIVYQLLFHGGSIQYG
ncbi:MULTISPECIES: DUF5680 domain-containing protein [unclassified Paenibacillus]|uniref:DUF5680 domain-containing protein n=1 Tax=unclassified Paenibacillus TaxID=185978 RepID=UPI00115F869D|nr:MULTISPECIES: DUF5680 domain-containing protein [unclassified Paenibacillus]